VIDLEQNGYLLSEVSMKAEFTQVFELTLSEKLQLLEDLWDSIALVPEQIPVLDWQKEELARRKAVYLQNPGSGSSWEAAKERIRNRQHRA
jgi:putative addiction module component (TIGR02574 family)